MDWGVISAKTVLIVAIIYGNLDRNRSINQSNDSGWDTNEVCVTTIAGTCITVEASVLPF